VDSCGNAGQRLAAKSADQKQVSAESDGFRGIMKDYKSGLVIVESDKVSAESYAMDKVAPTLNQLVL
jgi:hypothetical protein